MQLCLHWRIIKTGKLSKCRSVNLHFIYFLQNDQEKKHKLNPHLPFYFTKGTEMRKINQMMKQMGMIPDEKIQVILSLRRVHVEDNVQPSCMLISGENVFNEDCDYHPTFIFVYFHIVIYITFFLQGKQPWISMRNDFK